MEIKEARQNTAINNKINNNISALKAAYDKASDFLISRGYDKFLSEGYLITPGLCDVHVHFRQPGFEYKETVASGSSAAAHGGYTAVCTMPNLNPVPDSVENLQLQLDKIKEDAKIAVIPYGAITVGEMGETIADMEGMAPYVCAFSDDGRGVQNREMMSCAMKRAKALNKIIAAHCEDNTKLFGGYIHDGNYAKRNGHRGISSESEYAQIERDLEIAASIGCGYHVCHISAKESVELIRQAKKSGVDVTCETAPHYLILCDEDLRDEGRFKMNPPLRSAEDRDALLEGICDGTIDIIATDHAPHSAEEKSGGLEKSLMGVVGVETAFAEMYTRLVKPGVISAEKLVRLMSVNPRERFVINTDVGFSVFDIRNPYTVDPSEFVSKGRATPFEGDRVFGQCLMTVYYDRIVWEK